MPALYDILFRGADRLKNLIAIAINRTIATCTRKW